MGRQGDCAASTSAVNGGSGGLGDKRADGEEYDDQNEDDGEECDDTVAGAIRGRLDDAGGRTSDVRAAEIGASQAPGVLWSAPHGRRKPGAQSFYAARKASVDTVLHHRALNSPVSHMRHFFADGDDTFG